MGTRTWMLVYADANAREALGVCPPLDRAATAQLAAELFPEERFELLGDVDLRATAPAQDQICIGCFAGVSVVAARDFADEHPSNLPPRFLGARPRRTITLVAMDGGYDWFAYAQWIDGTLVRSLSVSPDDGVLEEIGSRRPFEEPYWAGRYPVEVEEGDDAYPLPFHPLTLAEAALGDLFGYHLDGIVDEPFLEPPAITLVRYQRTSRSR